MLKFDQYWTNTNPEYQLEPSLVFTLNNLLNNVHLRSLGNCTCITVSAQS